MEFSIKTMLTIFFFVPSFSLLNSFELPSNETFVRWNSLLEMKLYDLMVTVTRFDFTKNVYTSDTAISIQKINGEDILKSVLKKIGNLLRSKKIALKKLVDKAEQKYSAFKKLNKPLIAIDDLSFINVKALKPTVNMVYSSRFQQPVSYDESGVHIPLEIFDGWMGPRYKEGWWHDSEILNGVNWTASLDDTFKENYKRDPNLGWQYFGSFYGFMRVYPALRWPDHPSLPDFFDVRRRSWYIQSSVTPKDVIILIDRSGSVHGPTLDIMKITARALLNSLGENDYVNVAWFNNKVKWVVPCLNTLAQATAQIKRLLGDAIERLTESNLTSYTTALDFAFEEFKRFDDLKKPWAGSNCQRIVMFLSDGGTEWPTDLISRHCNESHQDNIKIFTFACGPHPIPTVVLKEMACSTGGYFSPITALGSVRIKIRDYIKVLSRPLAFSKDSNMYQWHNFYRDIGGLGMVTTLTLPVFNKSPRDSKTIQLLGVMGIDIPIEEMTELFPNNVLGPFGYPFAVNTNGFVIFHPRLQDHIVYIEDPPNIYLTDLEGSFEQIKEMEIAIIDGKNGSLKNFASIVPTGLGHAVLVNMDYYYGTVDSTTFRFGLALPSNHEVAKVKIYDVNEWLPFLLSIKGAFIAPWKFCSGDSTDSEYTLQSLAEQISKNHSLCDENLINHLLWDSKNALKIIKNWNESIYTGVFSRFLITSSGLTIVEKVKEEGEKYVRQKDPLKNNLFKKASCTESFVFSLSKDKHRVTVARRITLNESYVAAVIGVDIGQKLIQDVFEETVGVESDESCQSSEFMHCYLLNDGGLVTASNVERSKPGNFIGLHDPELLEFLLSEKVLKREYRYNYQSWCSRDTYQAPTMAATRHVSVLNLFYEAVTAFHWNFLYTILLYLVSCITAFKKSESIDQILETGNHTCVTRSAWYFHNEILEYPRSGIIDCKSHTRSFRISFLKSVKLFFLVSQLPCNNTEYSPVTLDPVEDTEFHYCINQQHYRLRPGKCYTQTPKGSVTDCGATSSSTLAAKKTAVFLASTILICLQLHEVFKYKFYP